MADSETSDAVELKRRADCLSSLIQRFGLDSALIGVPKLARLLGMGASTIYSYMRTGRFFMPYRMVNGTPMVKLDDAVSWYLSAEGEVALNAAAPPSSSERPSDPERESSSRSGSSLLPAARRGRPRSPEPASHGASFEYQPSDVTSKEDADRAIDGLVASVLARMDKQPSSRSKRLRR